MQYMEEKDNDERNHSIGESMRINSGAKMKSEYETKNEGVCERTTEGRW